MQLIFIFNLDYKTTFDHSEFLKVISTDHSWKWLFFSLQVIGSTATLSTAALTHTHLTYVQSLEENYFRLMTLDLNPTGDLFGQLTELPSERLC